MKGKTIQPGDEVCFQMRLGTNPCYGGCGRVMSVHHSGDDELAYVEVKNAKGCETPVWLSDVTAINGEEV